MAISNPKPPNKLIPFTNYNFPGHWKVLVLAPHPDDFDAIAVTLKQIQKQGNEIWLNVLTSGASGVEDSFCTPSTIKNKEQTRENEQVASCKIFGLAESRISFSNLIEAEDGHPTLCPENCDKIESILTSIKPDAIFMPHPNDTNPAHQRCYQMAYEYLTSQPSLNPVFFLNQDPKTVELKPQLYTAFSIQEAKWKASLLRCHRSQHQRNLNTRYLGFDYRILSYNQTLSRKYNIPAPYTEIFEMQQS